MKIITFIYMCLGWLCAGISAFCIGYALISRDFHVLGSGALYMMVALAVARSRREDAKRDEEESERKRG